MYNVGYINTIQLNMLCVIITNNVVCQSKQIFYYRDLCICMSIAYSIWHIFIICPLLLPNY